MKNKESKKLILRQDLVRYSKQIGIINIPTLVFTPKDFDSIGQNKRRTKRNRWLGCCVNMRNLILVNLEYTGPVYRRRWLRKGKTYRRIPKKWNLIEATHTLVHELIHYRWPSMGHGYRFDKRIDEIIRGRTFEPPNGLVPEVSPSLILETRKEPTIPRQFELIRLQL